MADANSPSKPQQNPADESNGDESNSSTFTYDHYSEERKLQANFEKESIENFQKAILTLSASFLAFSLTFLGLLNNLASRPIKFESLDLLAVSWIAFASSMILMIAAYATTIPAHRKEVQHAWILYNEGEKAANEVKNPWSNATTVSQIISTVTFLIGVSFLLYFCMVNINKMGGQDGTQSKQITETHGEESTSTEKKTAEKDN